MGKYGENPYFPIKPIWGKPIWGIPCSKEKLEHGPRGKIKK